MGSFIEIKVTGIPEVNDSFSLTQNYFQETFKTQRQANYQIPIASDISGVTKNIFNALSLDYNRELINDNNYNLEQTSSDTVRVEYYGGNNFFDNYNNDSGHIILTPGNTPSDVYDVNTIDVQGIGCDDYSLAVSTSKTTYSASYLTFGGLITEIVNSSVFSLTIPRGINPNGYLKLISLDSEVIETYYNEPSSWNAIVNQEQTFNGITAIINVFADFTFDYEFQYSLDGINYQPSNIYTGLMPGEYTFYVKDKLGCEKTFDASLTEEDNSLKPYLYASRLNSFFYAKRNEGLRNIENTLSYEEKGNNYRQFYHRPSINNIDVEQFRSSYTTNEVKLIQDGEEIQTLNNQQISDNINVVDARYGNVYADTTKGEVYVQFTTNLNVIDPVTLDVIGLSTLNKTVLFAHEIGVLVNIEGFGWLPISDIRDGEDLNIEGQYLVFEYQTTGSQNLGSKIIKTQYNIEDYEVFEFSLNTQGLAGCYQIQITGSNNDGATESLLSEPILIDIDLENFHNIVWKNSENNDITWQTGIEGEGNYRKLQENEFNAEVNNEIYTTDTATRQLDSEYDERFSFHFDYMPLSITRQLTAVFSQCDYLMIDGLFYTNAEPETEKQYGSNLYRLSITVTRTTGLNSNSRAETNDTNINTNGYLKQGQGYVELS